VKTFSNGKDMSRRLTKKPNYEHSRKIHAGVLKAIIVTGRGIGCGAGGSMTLIPESFTIQGARKIEEIIEISRAACR
jgi:hypothetical protein